MAPPDGWDGCAGRACRRWRARRQRQDQHRRSGVGTRGNAGIDWLKKAAPDTVTIAAICDTFQGYTGQLRERSRSAGREFHRRGVQHDAGASASRHGMPRFERAARVSRKPLAHTIVNRATLVHDQPSDWRDRVRKPMEAIYGAMNRGIQ
jgi:hypothetical protein